MLKNDPHPLAGTRKGKYLQNLKHFFIFLTIFDNNFLEGPLLEYQTQRFPNFHESYFIRAGRLVGLDVVFVSGSDVMANGQTSYEISHDKILVSLEDLEFLTYLLALFVFLVDVLHRTLGFLVTFLKDCLEQLLVLRLVGSHVVYSQLLEDHLVLRQSAGLVA